MLDHPLLAFLGAFSPMHMLFILAVALLLFGNGSPPLIPMGGSRPRHGPPKRRDTRGWPWCRDRKDG